VTLDPNSLENKPDPRISGRHLLLFVVICPAAIAAGVWLQRETVAGADMMAMLLVFFGGALVAVILAAAPLGRWAWPALGFRPTGWRPLVLGPLAALAVSVAVSQLGIEPEAMKQALEFGRDPAKLAFSLFVIAILAPIVEELVFRGLLYGWLESRWSASVAFLVSSLAFAAAHWEPAHIILVVPLGFLFGWLRLRTNSLWPPLIAHAANNGVAVLAAALLG